MCFFYETGWVDMSTASLIVLQCRKYHSVACTPIFSNFRFHEVPLSGCGHTKGRNVHALQVKLNVKIPPLFWNSIFDFCNTLLLGNDHLGEERKNLAE